MRHLIRGLFAMAVFAALAVTTSGCQPQYKADTGGSEQYQEKVKKGQPLYTPPPGAPIPPGARQPGAPR